MILKPCPCCERPVFINDIRRRIRNTAYEREELNYLRSCGDCYEADCTFFQRLWDEYNQSRL